MPSCRLRHDGTFRTYPCAALYVLLLLLILSTLAMALVLRRGVVGQGRLTALDISLSTLTAFVLLFQRFFVAMVPLGSEWQGCKPRGQAWCVQITNRGVTCPKSVL